MVRISFMPLALAATTAIASASARTNLYLSPAHNLDAPIGVNAEEAHRILSHHISVDEASNSPFGAEMWSHLLKNNKVGQVDVDQRAMVERLFDGHRDDEQNRLLVLMHGAAHNGE